MECKIELCILGFKIRTVLCNKKNDSLNDGKSNWCLLSMVFDCWIVSAILSLNQSGYGFPKPSWTQEPSSNGIVLMAVLQYGGQTAVVQRYFVNSHILHTFNIQWV